MGRYREIIFSSELKPLNGQLHVTDWVMEWSENNNFSHRPEGVVVITYISRKVLDRLWFRQEYSHHVSNKNPSARHLSYCVTAFIVVNIDFLRVNLYNLYPRQSFRGSNCYHQNIFSFVSVATKVSLFALSSIIICYYHALLYKVHHYAALKMELILEDHLIVFN